MIDLTISSCVICLGFIAGLWDRESQWESRRGAEKKSHSQPLKAALKTNDPSVESEKPRPDAEMVLTLPFTSDTPQRGRTTVILSVGRTGHKELECDIKGK